MQIKQKACVRVWRVDLFLDNSMAFQELRLDYSLEGALNFCSWKERILVVLEDYGVLEYVKQEIAPP